MLWCVLELEPSFQAIMCLINYIHICFLGMNMEYVFKFEHLFDSL